MSTNSALVDLRLPAPPAATQRGIKLTAAIRRLVGRPRCSQERRSLNIGDSYLIADRRRGSQGVSNWVHTHH